MTENVLRAYYDFAVAPPTFDICTFLYLAEMERLHLGADEIELIIVANTGDGFRDETPLQSTEENFRRLQHIVIPAHRLLPSCRSARYIPDRRNAMRDFDPAAPVFPAGYTVERPVASYLDSDVLIARYANKTFGSLRAPAEAVELVAQWLGSHVDGRKPVVITLRESERQQQRNSNLHEWVRFAASLDHDIYRPVFVRDTASLFKKKPVILEDFLTFDAAALDIQLRLALYESAYINLHVDSGPAACCMLDDLTRMIRFRTDSRGDTTLNSHDFLRRGYERDMQWVNCTTFQVTIWENDEFEVITRSFKALADRIEEGLSPTRVALPPATDTMTRFIAGGNFADAIRLADQHLARHPTDIEAQFLVAIALSEAGDYPAALKEFESLFRMPHAQNAVVVPAATCLWKSGRVVQAVDLLTGVAQERGENHSLLRSIGRLLLEIGESDAGAEIVYRALEIEPDDLDLLICLAGYLQNENLSIPKALAVLERALELAPTDASVHYEAAICHGRAARYEQAIQHLAKAIDLHGFGQFDDWVKIGTWASYLGNPNVAHATFMKAEATIDTKIKLNISHDDRIKALAQRAYLSLLRGNELNSHRAYEEILAFHGKKGLLYADDVYLPRTPERLQRLENIINDRDVFIFCHGPSISTLDQRWREFAQYDPCLMSLNRFRVFETGFLARSRATLDVIILTHYCAYQRNMDQILEFLDRSSDNMLITTKWAAERLGRHCPSRQEIESRFNEKLLYFGGTNHTTAATPNHPLRFLLGNTLSILISFATIGKARRIFLFGADGGIPSGRQTITHYGADSADFRFDVTENHRVWIRDALAADTTAFAHVTEMGLIAAEHLFGVKRPPIYNVSPDSAIDLFPRITYNEALELLRADASAAGGPAAAAD